MVPAGAFGVAVFLLLIVPGTCYELLRQRTRPPRGESPFVEISRILLTGVLITAFTLILLGAIRFITPAALLDASTLLRHGISYVASHLGLTIWSVSVELILSSLMAVAIYSFRRNRNDRQIVLDDPWHAAAERLADPSYKVIVSLTLKNGMQIIGVYGGASTDPDPSKREVLLVSPLKVWHAGSSEGVDVGEGYDRLVVPGSEVALFVTRYERSAKQPQERVKPPFYSRAYLRVKKSCPDWLMTVVAVGLTMVIVILFGVIREIFN